MAEPFETLREVGVALDGFRSDVRGQFTTLKWIMGGVGAAGLLVAGVLFTKVDALEESAARNTAILERIEKAMSDVASNTNEIKEAVQTAAVAPDAPSPSLIPGWKGVPLAEFGNLEDLQIAVGAQEGITSSKAWVYIPAE